MLSFCSLSGKNCFMLTRIFLVLKNIKEYVRGGTKKFVLLKKTS